MASSEGGGMMPLYGVAISDAIENPASNLDRLLGLRERGRALLEAQGDLPGALARLEAEIERRGGKTY